jgi:hypothetical protein
VRAYSSIERTATGKLAAAAHVKRVCQAWHSTSEVQGLGPGKRGAEGEEQGKGVHRCGPIGGWTSAIRNRTSAGPGSPVTPTMRTLTGGVDRRGNGGWRGCRVLWSARFGSRSTRPRARWTGHGTARASAARAQRAGLTGVRCASSRAALGAGPSGGS